jgi:hypothetical protein
MRRLATAAVAVIALTVSACVLVEPPLPPAPTGPVPDLAGTWRGTWASEPLTLLVVAQPAEPGPGGVYLGNYELLGGRRPGITGVLTSTIRGTAVSSRAEGWLGSDASGRLVVLVRSETPDGVERLTLVRVSENRLQGTGDSSFRWGPRGPAELTRTPR